METDKNEDFIFLYEYFKLDPDGEPIQISSVTPFDNKDLRDARKDMEYDLNEMENKSENDIAVITYIDSKEGQVIDTKIFKNNIWQDLIDSNYITNNKFKLFYSDEFTFSKQDEFRLSQNFNIGKEKVETWNDIIKNFNSFKEIDNSSDSQTLKNYSQFFHWYYLPEMEMFAPSKFLGYKDTTIDNYNSAGNGGVTQRALSKFFEPLDRNSDEFKKLYRELEQVSRNNFKKDLSYKVLNGQGGIYIPKKN